MFKFYGAYSVRSESTVEMACVSCCVCSFDESSQQFVAAVLKGLEYARIQFSIASSVLTDTHHFAFSLSMMLVR
jgi:hypothetical protein